MFCLLTSIPVPRRMKLYNQTGNREESPVRLADDLLDEPTRSTEGASLEIRRMSRHKHAELLNPPLRVNLSGP